VVDLDLESFFDRVNHDRLMASIAQRISDKRLLKLIRSFLTAGVMEDGLVGKRGGGRDAARRSSFTTVEQSGVG
jgi:RNA-directed DNA polymerase